MTTNEPYEPKVIQSNVLEIVENCFISENNGNLDARAEAMKDLESFLVETDEGSYTIKCQDSEETMHTFHGGIKESVEKYVKPSHLNEKSEMKILDVCSGLGYTAATCIEQLNQPQEDGGLPVLNIEMVEISALTLATGLIVPSPIKSHMIIKKAIEDQLYLEGFLTNRLVNTKIPENINININITDARNLVKNDPNGNGTSKNFVNDHAHQFDAIFLLAFSPFESPELYSLEFLSGLKPLLKPDGMISSFSKSHTMRYSLVKAGFHIGEGPEFGRSGGTIASTALELIEKPISVNDERVVALSDAGVPLRDLTLGDSSLEILERRNNERESVRGKLKFPSTIRCPVFLGQDMEESRLKRRVMNGLKTIGIDNLHSKESMYLICPQYHDCVCGNSCKPIDNSRDRIIEMEKRLNILAANHLSSKKI
ncbi:MAG: MnmC family methyltransferase [Methanobacterium sp. ERen5]|nr:MAG: MnmC family methyltransferase [Methanobacterium sp. ERen5]